MNSKIIKPIISLLLAFFLPAFSGCASKHVILDRAIVQNDTPGIITEVKVVHEPTGKTGAVSMILPDNAFELGFAGQPMLGEHAIVTWRDHEGYLRKFEGTLPDNPDTKTKGKNFILIYTIESAGVARIHLESSNL